MAYAMQKYILLIAFGVLSLASLPARADDSDYPQPEDYTPYGSVYKKQSCQYYDCSDDKDTSDKYKNIAPRAGNNDPYEPHEARAPKGSDAAIMRGLLQDR